MRRMLLGIALLGLVVTFIGCNTVKGLGEDVSAVGGWMVKGADNVEKAN